MYIANSYIPKQERFIIRSILTNKNTPPLLKKQAQRFVCYHYIPLALKESKRFSLKHKISVSLYRDVNSIAITGLIKGVYKYDWSVKYSNIHVFLKKYILGELYHSHILYNHIYDTEKLEWSFEKSKTNMDRDNDKSQSAIRTPYFGTYYQDIYETIIQTTEKLTPYEKRFFFLVYNKMTLQKNKYSVSQLCELLGISNEETYRYQLILIIEKLKNYMRKEHDHNSNYEIKS
jgi:DNA-directed RNA polymerase specialized sigma subunit